MITLVGCGFLGSLAAEEFAKMWFAFNETTPFRLIDSDKFEERNAANQNVSVLRARDNVAKAVHIAGIVGDHGIQEEIRTVRIDKSNIDEHLAGTTVLVSAVDNMPTRRLLWYYAKQHKIPLLSLGVSQAGTGVVEWTIGNYDTWSLSPLVTMGQRKKLDAEANIPQELKPCELIAFRGLGLNTAVAAAKSLGVWMGFDPAKVLEQDVLKHQFALSWNVTNTGHYLFATSPDMITHDPFAEREVLEEVPLG